MKRTGQSKIAVVGWGRGMGHKGHMYLADAVIQQAKDMNADPYFFVSKTVGKDDPILPEEKVRIYQKVFPQHATIFEPQGNLNQALTDLAGLGYQGVVVVVGADQKEAFQYLVKPNKEGVPVYQTMGLKKLKVISRQETRSQYRGEEGPRATPMREILLDPNATEEDKFKVWRRDMPEQLSDREVLDVMNKAESRMMHQPAKQAKVKQMSQKVAKLKEAIQVLKTKNIGNKDGAYQMKPQGVAEGTVGDKIKGAAKSIKRAVQWDSGPEMVTPAGTVKAFKDMDGQHLANFVASRKELPAAKKGSARAFADKVIDREMKQRGYGRVADKDEQGVAEGSDNSQRLPSLLSYIYSNSQNQFSDFEELEDLFDYAYLDDVDLQMLAQSAQENGVSAQKEATSQVAWLLKNIKDKSYLPLIKPLAVQWIKLVSPALDDYIKNVLSEQSVAEGVTPASVSKVLRLINRHHPEWFDNYGMGEVEDTVVDLADMGQFSGMSATDALELVGQELESLYGQQGMEEGYIFKDKFPFDVDHMPGSVIRNRDETTDIVKTKNKDKWDDMVDLINDKVFDDMADFRTNSEGETVTGNSAVWAKWDNKTQTGWINRKGNPLKPWPVNENEDYLDE